MKRSFLMLSIFLTAPLLIALSGNASAAVITFTSVSGNWHHPTNNVSGTQTGDPVITNGTQISSINWGVPTPASGPQSGYDFARTIPGAQTLPPAPTPLFPLGTFNHRNFTVGDPTLTSVFLDVVLLLKVDGVDTGPLPFTFKFNHVETPNAPPCPYPTPSGQGCTDRVTFASSPQPTTFNVGGVNYTLSMSFVDDNGQPVSQFLTRENLENTANLVGQFTVAPPPGGSTCGDGQCDGSETCSNCSLDCGGCPPPPPPPSVSQFNLLTHASINEGGGMISISVLRSVDTSGTSTVQYATSNGTAVAGQDYVGVTGTLTFGPGEVGKQFDIPIIDDQLVEGNETANLTISNPTNATIGVSQALLTIVDNDTTPPPPPPATVPFISQLVPFSAPVGFSSTFEVRILGSGFDAASAQVIWDNRVTLITMPVVSRSASEIVVTVDPAIWNGAPATHYVIVRNPGPADSNTALFYVRDPGNGNPPPFLVSGPSANPNPTYTKTTTLTALGGTLSAGGESVLTYEWKLSGNNPSSNVTFSNNGTHAGSTSVATFPGPGTYHVIVRVRDTVTQFAIDSAVLDVVVIRNATSITVTPHQQVIAVDTPLNLTATVADQWGVSMNMPASWSSSAGSLASNGQSASFSINDASIRQATITALVTNALGAPLSDSAQVTVVVSGAGLGGDLSNAKAYPVPFKGNSGDPGINFTGLAPGTKIRIFTITGRHVQTLDSPNGDDTLWDVRNANLDNVSSGVYMYLIEAAGQKKEGKLVVIK